MSIKHSLRADNDYIYYDGIMLEVYIPQYYFDSKLAVEKGEVFNVFAIVSARSFDSKGKGNKLETINVPSFINMYPSATEKREMSLSNNEEPKKYNVLKFFKGDRLMDRNIPKNSDNVELFVELVCGAKLPRTIPYDELISVWLKNLELNDINLSVSSVGLETILRQMNRNPKKPEEPFAIAAANGKLGMNDYKPASIREVSARTSTFTALTFESMDDMIVTSLNINNYNKEETESPVEKLIKM